MNIIPSVELNLNPPPCLLAGEHMLSFYCDLGEMKEEENKNDGDGKKTGGKDDKIKPSSMIFLAELPVSEKWTVRQLKGRTIVITILFLIKPTYLPIYLSPPFINQNHHINPNLRPNSILPTYHDRAFAATLEYVRICFHWTRYPTTPSDVPSSYTSA